jgi:hypothetical protein
MLTKHYKPEHKEYEPKHKEYEPKHYKPEHKDSYKPAYEREHKAYESKHYKPEHKEYEPKHREHKPKYGYKHEELEHFKEGGNKMMNGDNKAADTTKPAEGEQTNVHCQFLPAVLQQETAVATDALTKMHCRAAA